MKTADPLLRLLPIEVPRAFEVLPEPEQAWRGRLFLMTWGIGFHEGLAWETAMDRDPEHIVEQKVLVEATDDDLIRARVRARRDAERSGARVGLNDL